MKKTTKVTCFNCQTSLAFDSQAVGLCVECRREALRRRKILSALPIHQWETLAFDDFMTIYGSRTPRKTLFNIAQMYVYHSPSGMEWGYGGSGPADLALNILSLWFQPKIFPQTSLRDLDGTLALALHQRFKEDVIAPWQGDQLIITGDEIVARWLRLPRQQIIQEWRSRQ